MPFENDVEKDHIVEFVVNDFDESEFLELLNAGALTLFSAEIRIEPEPLPLFELVSSIYASSIVKLLIVLESNGMPVNRNPI